MYMTISNHLREIGKDKKNLINGCRTNWTTTKRNRYEVSSSLLLRNKNCDLRWKVGSLRQPATFSSVGRRWLSSMTLPEARVAPKEGHADCLVVCDRSHPLVFWMQAKPLQRTSTVNKWMKCIRNFNNNTQH